MIEQTLTEAQRKALLADPRVYQLVIEASVEGEIRGYSMGYTVGADSAHNAATGYQAGYEAGQQAGWDEGYDYRRDEEEAGAIPQDLPAQILERNRLWASYNTEQN